MADDIDSLKPQRVFGDNERNIRRAIFKIRSWLQEKEPSFLDKIPSDAASASGIITTLSSVFQDTTQPLNVRNAAVRVIGAVIAISRSYGVSPNSGEAQATLYKLINSLQDPIFQLSIIACLRHFAPQESSAIIPALLKGPICNGVPVAVIAALKTLRECDQFEIVRRLDELMPLLEHEDVSVRCEAYIMFGLLGNVTLGCLPTLIKRLRLEHDGPALYELVKALVLIDREGDRLLHSVRRTSTKQTANLKRGKKSPLGEERPAHLADNAQDENDQDKLLRLLRLLPLHVESGGDCTWYWTLSKVQGVLNKYWNSPAAPAGYRRMSVKQIISYISAKKDPVNPKTIGNWIAAGKLTAIHQPGNLYDIRVDELERLRTDTGEVNTGPSG